MINWKRWRNLTWWNINETRSLLHLDKYHFFLQLIEFASTDGGNLEFWYRFTLAKWIFVVFINLLTTLYYNGTCILWLSKELSLSHNVFMYLWIIHFWNDNLQNRNIAAIILFVYLIPNLEISLKVICKPFISTFAQFCFFFHFNEITVCKLK